MVIFANYILSCCLYFLPAHIPFGYLPPGFPLEHSTKASFLEVTTEDLLSMYNGLFDSQPPDLYVVFYTADQVSLLNISTLDFQIHE